MALKNVYFNVFIILAIPEILAYGLGKTHIGMTGYKPLKDMIEALFSGYEKRIRPFHKGAPLDILVNTYIVELLHVDEFNEEFTLDLIMREYWVEPRLTFVPKPNIGSIIHLDPEQSKLIWVPDTFIANERKESYYEKSIQQEWIRIKSDGEVRRSIRRTLTAGCGMTYYFYPFDRHFCTLDIESYRQDSENVHYDWRGGSITPELFATGIAWNATNGTVVPFRVMSLHASKYEIEFTTGNFSRLAVEITLRKFWGVYFSKYYVPLFLFLLISLTTLFIRQPSFSLTFNFINLLCFHLFLLVPDIGAAVPRTEYYKANDLYLYASLIFLYFSFLVSLAILIGNKNREPGFEYKDPKTYVRVGKDLSPDESLRLKEGLVEQSLPGVPQTQHSHTQTSFESSITRILRVCYMLRWIVTFGYIFIQLLFWIVVIVLSKAYLWPEALILVDYDF